MELIKAGIAEIRTKIPPEYRRWGRPSLTIENDRRSIHLPPRHYVKNIAARYWLWSYTKAISQYISSSNEYKSFSKDLSTANAPSWYSLQPEPIANMLIMSYINEVDGVHRFSKTKAGYIVDNFINSLRSRNFGVTISSLVTGVDLSIQGFRPSANYTLR